MAFDRKRRRKQTDSESALLPVQKAVIRGLGVVLPALLTIIFLLWIWNSVQSYVLAPMKHMVQYVAVQSTWDVMNGIPSDADKNDYRYDGDNRIVAFDYNAKTYRRLPSEEWIPFEIYARVRHNLGEDLPETAKAYFLADIEQRWFRPGFLVPFFFGLFILGLYLLGKFFAARLGRIVQSYVERIIDQVPIIRTVYGTVKQVTDIIFGESEIEYTRVVAVEYPRKGMWSVGFVTGESMLALAEVAGEPVLSVLMPTSPMPATGFTITVRKSETVDLDISVDQAFQFVVSCGVVSPDRVVNGEVARDIERKVRAANPQAIPAPSATMDQSSDPPTTPLS